MAVAHDVPRVAVVVIGRNEGERLARCLDSVHAMDYPEDRFEIIYVDSDSTDDSVRLAKAKHATVLEVKPERPAAAIGRNAGWRAADAEFVLFLDGDTVLHADFLRMAIAEFADERIAVVFGHRREIATDASLYNRALDLDWVYPLGEFDFCGGDAVMRRSVLAEVDGYDDTLIAGEEPDLCGRMRALGHVVLHIDAPMTGHDMDMHRFSQYWKRAVRSGHAYAEISERFKDSDDPFWSAEAERTLKHAALVAGTPVAGVVASVATRSPWPVAGVVAFWTAVLVRTAKRARWKDPDPGTRALYAVHTWVQKVPLAWGQLAFRRDRAKGERRGLIEYK
ncbi:MAG: glycosyltransferase [Actinomycetota bacterium]